MNYKFSLRDWTGHGIRDNIVELSAFDHATKKNVFKKVLEYTEVFEEKSGTKHLAHGYGLALGKLQVLVQHTSTKAIIPDLANEMAYDLIYIHLKQEAARRAASQPGSVSPQNPAP